MPAITRTRRSPSERERALLEARAARERASLQTHGVSHDALLLALVGVAMASIGAWRLEGFPRWLVALFGAALALIGALGTRRERAAHAARVSAIDQRHARRSAEVEELSFAPRRGVTATSPDGGGESFWIFELSDGSHLAFSDDQWPPGSAPPDAWRASTSVVLDGESSVLAVEGEGSAIELALHHLRAPDFSVDASSRFWAPEVDGPPPWVVDAPALKTLDEIDERG